MTKYIKGPHGRQCLHATCELVLHVLRDIQPGHTKRVDVSPHPHQHVFRRTYFRKWPDLLSITVESGSFLADLR